MNVFRRWTQGLVLGASAALLIACSSQPVPDWQIASASAVQQAVDAYLSGIDKVADVEFARAQREARRSADPEAVARTYLMACAAHVSALDFVDCGEEPGLRDASAATQAYARYLMAMATSEDLALLPKTQRSVATQAREGRAVAVADLDLAWSRLVAAGVLWRQGQRDLAVAQVAVDTASAQGWSRAVGVWLKAQQQLLSEAGQAEAAARVQRRLDLLLNSPTATARPN